MNTADVDPVEPLEGKRVPFARLGDIRRIFLQACCPLIAQARALRLLPA